MVKKNYLIAATILIFTSCKKESRTPACIDNKVNEFKNTVSCNTGTNVKQYEFQSKMVYVFDPGTCGADMASEVFDDNCNSLGFLGGIMGNTKINGEDFSKAKLTSTIWSR
jgi:hypothetical protein